MNKNHKKDIFLQSERLFLRKFRLDDINTFIKYRNDPQVARYQSWLKNIDDSFARSFIEKQMTLELGIIGQWHQIALELKSGGHIGDCATLISDDGKQAEFGITIASEYQGKGYAFEALKTLFTHLFQELKIHRITGLVDIDNLGSIGLQQKLGMRKEAHFIESFLDGKQWHNEYLFAVLAKEFL